MNKLKKFLAGILSAMLLFVNGFHTTTNVTVAVGSLLTGIADAIHETFEIYKMGSEIYIAIKEKHNEEEFRERIIQFIKSCKSGFKTNCYEAIGNIKNNVGRSPIQFYGQHAAKDKCVYALTYYFDRLCDFKAQTEKRELISDKFRLEPRNVFYILGEPGTGKTTLAMAIADAVLKDATYTLFIAEVSEIVRGKPLGDQLFKVQQKFFSVEAKKWLSLSEFTQDQSDSREGEFNSHKINAQGQSSSQKEELTSRCPIVEQREASAQLISNMLAHLILCDYKAVIVIENYNLMKKTANPEGNDTTADEILKSIASTGRYTIGSHVIDCSESLFIVTSHTNLRLEH